MPDKYEEPESSVWDEEDDIEIVPVIPEEPVIFFGKEINAVLFEMLAGIIIFGFICQITVIWFISDTLGFSLGLWLGIIIAIGYAIHMWWSIEQYLYMGAYAAGMARKHMMFRYMIVAIVLVFVAATAIVQFLAVVLGILGIKAGAFIQPFIQKIIRSGKINE
ncbi:MAG: hypothetical protein FWE14_12620 [Lachnospiraceae bacterium]|nr:hypothetical protein [Lachnospiraceae bacterium]